MTNFKRKLLAGLFVPVLGLSVGTALAQSTAPAAGSSPPPNSSTATPSTTNPATTPSSGSGTTTGMTPGAMGNTSWNAQTFDRIDKNRDGRISREEAEADAAMKGAWSKMDAANRGSVSKEEFEKYRTMQPGANPVAGSSPPPNSSTALPSTTDPATTPSSGMKPK